MIEIAILVVVMGGGAVALKLLNGGGGEERLDEAWRTAARHVGGEVELTEPRFLTPRERRIRVKVEGVELCLETILPRNLSVGTGEVETRLTSSGFTSPFGLRLELQKRDLLRTLSKKLGIGEHPIGVPTAHVRRRISRGRHATRAGHRAARRPDAAHRRGGE